MASFPTGNILHVDLTESKFFKTELHSDTYRLYPGGSALGVYLATKKIKPGIDPLSPENCLVFSVSPLTGLPISGISRMNVTAKSPLTGGIGDSQSGGFFPVHLKANGLDAIEIVGRAENPVYLYIDGEKVEIKDASAIWGKVTGEAEAIIKQELGREDIEISQIGPGGENMVKFACIISMCSRANGRNGMGAVMGSKNLKAIVVAKGKSAKPYDPDRFYSLSKSASKLIETNGDVFELGKFGTDGGLKSLSEKGFLPTKNWTSGNFPEGAPEINGINMYNTVLKERDTCFSCIVRCKRVVEIPDKVDPLYGGPEYETAAALGSYCGVTSLEDVCIANQLCNMYGLDTISCGATIAFAMEAFEKGLIDKSDTDGIELIFGNGQAVNTLIEKIAKLEGFGEKLAQGSYRYAESLGEEALKLTATVKKQELPAHMPQFKPSVGLIYAVNPFGADHQSSEHDTVLVLPEDSLERKRLAKLGIIDGYRDTFIMDQGKVRFAYTTQKYFSILDSLCLCQFVWGASWELFGPDELIELCRSGIGWDVSIEELLEIGERRINMMRAFNSTEGFTKDDDKLPEKMYVPLKGGPTEGVVLSKSDHESALGMYYEMAGWDKTTGNPTDDTLIKNSLQWLIKG